mgnify:FL=1
MQDNPKETKKPRFLSGSGEKSRGQGGYQGRFLNKTAPQPDNTDTPSAPPEETPEETFSLPPVTAEDFLTEAAAPQQESAPPAPEEPPVPQDAEDAAPLDAPEAPALPPVDDRPEDLPDEIPEDLFPEDAELPPEEQDHVLTPSDFADRLSNPQTEDDQEFGELFTAPQEPEETEVPVREHPAPKGRPKRRGGEGLLGIPNILVTVVWIAITLAIGVTLGRMAWVCAADVLAFGREDHKVTITISSTDDIDSIATKLKNANLIRYPGLFKLYASFAVDDGEIQPGIWDLNTLYDYHALVKMMSPSSQRSVITVMIPEGYSCRQIFELLQEKRVCTVESLESYAASGELDSYWFLDGLERGSKYCLEGYLFPDTYEFYTNDTAQNVLTKMLNNFDSRVDESIRSQLDSLNTHISQMMEDDGRSADYIASHQMTMADVITVASLIEKESASAEESYTIASVIYNRLYAWNGTPAYLNIDASVIYALDGKTDLTQEDLATDSPYNTYLNVGLTPGPIANPGINSIKAALEPQDTGYYYYILDPAAGTHHFSSTLEEHEAFREAIRG